MNKMIKGLLITALTLSANNAGAYTNKTYMQPRNQALVNLPLITTGFTERTGAKIEDRFGGNLEVVGFYGQNTNESETGAYFGVTNKATFDLKTGTMNAAKSGSLTVDPAYVLHLHTLVNDTVVATIKTAPETINYGADFVYHQDLAKIVKGLYLAVNLPVMHVENDMKMVVSGTDADVVTSVKAYFKGDVNTGYATEKLTKGKINGSRNATGIADIDVKIGYNFLKKETYHMGLNIGMSIPTGNEVTGEYMFEPVYGTKHFGLGGGLCADARIWGNANHNVKIDFKADYRYLLEATEKRTHGLIGRNKGEYYGVAAAGATTTTPLANISTLDTDVTPGSQVDGIVGLAYNKGGFNFGLGYNMYFREEESNTIKGAFDDAKYIVVARNHDIATTAIVTATAGHNDENTASNFVTKAKLDKAETPSQFTHSVYGGLNYAFKNWEYPVFFGLGGKYEFASKNSAIEGWQGWVKAGLSF